MVGSQPIPQCPEAPQEGGSTWQKPDTGNRGTQVKGWGRALPGGVKLNWGQNSFTHTLLPGGWPRWLCIRQSDTRRAEGSRGQKGKEHLEDEATVKLVQLLLGQHQPMSLSEASRTREGHFAQIDSVVLLLLLGPEEG